MEKYKLIPYRIAYIIVCNIMGKQFEDCSVVSIYFQYMKGVQNAHPLAHLLKTTLYSCSLYLLMLKLALQIIKGFTELNIASKMVQNVIIWGFVDFGNEL